MERHGAGGGADVHVAGDFAGDDHSRLPDGRQLHQHHDAAHGLFPAGAGLLSALDAFNRRGILAGADVALCIGVHVGVYGFSRPEGSII